MLADVLTAAASWHGASPLLTYLVPAALESELRTGQLVAIPYGERLVEGIIWTIRTQETPAAGAEDGDYAPEALRPLHAILDLEPALLPHQMALAEWMAQHYVTPLAQTALMMLPPGLMQRSQVVLRLAGEDVLDTLAAGDALAEDARALRLRALVGLLLADGELNVERLKEMLGTKRARELLKEARTSGLIAQDARLEAPRVRERMKRVVRLAVQGDALEEWQRRVEQQALSGMENIPDGATVGAGLVPAYVNIPPAHGNTKAHTNMSPVSHTSTRKGRLHMPDPWALPAATATLTPPDPASVEAQRQLAAVDLLQRSVSGAAPWTPGMLCKASGLTRAQLQRLERAGIIAIETAEVRRDPLAGRALPTSAPLTLTPDQQRALDCILNHSTPRTTVGAALVAAHANIPSAHATIPPTPILLHGVTGSGKTEVYLQALAAIIARGKRGIVLVPEIALTTQAVQRVAARFPDRVAIIHSELSMGERYDEWRRIRAGQVDVVIGSRSALFAPLPDLGIIIVDEEHEAAYKQSERRPTYHAREAALALGRILGIPVVLGSATPALESFYRAEQGIYRLVELPGRIGAAMPPVEVIDLRGELHAGNTSIISRRLQEELERVLSLGQQAILFLNRRGAASCVLCRDCGFVALCDRCDIPLTYHATERVLLCHYCGRQNKVLHFCPACRSSSIGYFGLGTEKVQDTIQRRFPSARLLRWDRDTARNRHAHEQLLDHFANREADILIGTQMIAKGLDLPGVTLVGVVSADIALNLPDFAASERAFTLLTQVAGRAGRGAEAGRVIIQTFNPQHFCIDTASRHDYHEFYAAEIEARSNYGYPPFRQFTKFTYSHENRHRCQNEALLLSERLYDWIERLGLANTDVVGPAPALIERIRGKYRWQLIARGPDLRPLLRVLDAPGWEIDIDPISTM
jgi:primosomal protein N' (replication factor Y)